MPLSEDRAEVRAFMLGLSCFNHQISEEPHACEEGSMLARLARLCAWSALLGFVSDPVSGNRLEAD